MSDDIEVFSDGSAGFVSARVPAWHRLGTVVESAMTANDVLKLAQLADWNVRQVQASFTENGITYPIPNRFATVRTNPVTGEPNPIEVVSDQYSVFQNEELAGVIDSVVDASGAHFETAGSLQNGRKVFVNMKLPEGFTVAGMDTEKHDLYMLGTTNHDGRGRIQFVTTPVRVVCQNTLTAALGNLVTDFKIRHKGDLGVKVQEVRDALEIQHQGIEEFQAAAERMLNTSMDDKAFTAMVDKLWPESNNLTARRRDHKLQWLWHDAKTTDLIRGTRWGAWQAVTEYIDHYDAPTGSAENRALRAVEGLGSTRKEKAYKLLAVS